LIVQTNGLNDADHPTAIMIPGTSNGDSYAPGDNFPLRVTIQKAGALTYDTDLLIDQVRSTSTRRLGVKLHTLPSNSMKQIEEAVRILMLRP